MSSSAVDTPSDEPRIRVGPFVVHGSTLVIDSNEPEMAAELDSRLRDLRPGDGTPGLSPVVYTVDRHGSPWDTHPWGVWRDGEPCQTAIVSSGVVAYVLWEITRLLLENVSPHVPIAAGAVTLEGRALVLAGRPQTGKSTLTAWLTTRGWGFLTDGVATLDVSGQPPGVLPFWRPVAVRPGGPLAHLIAAGGTDDPVLVPASAMGGLSPAAPLAAVVLPTYTPGHAHDLEPLSPAETLVGLAEHLPLHRH